MIRERPFAPFCVDPRCGHADTDHENTGCRPCRYPYHPLTPGGISCRCARFMAAPNYEPRGFVP